MRLVPACRRKDGVARLRAVDRAATTVEYMTVIGTRSNIWVLGVEDLGGIRFADLVRGQDVLNRNVGVVTASAMSRFREAEELPTHANHEQSTALLWDPEIWRVDNPRGDPITHALKL